MPHALSPQVPTRPGFVLRSLATVTQHSQRFLGLAFGLLVGAVPLMATASMVSASEGSAALTDGTYVFGESQVAGQVGATYMVLKVEDQQVIGGFYQPRSSFDCFHGRVAGQDLALTVVNSYDQTTYAYTMALESTVLTAAQSGAGQVSAPAGLHPIADMSAIDREVLSTCEANLEV